MHPIILDASLTRHLRHSWFTTIFTPFTFDHHTSQQSSLWRSIIDHHDSARVAQSTEQTKRQPRVRIGVQKREKNVDAAAEKLGLRNMNRKRKKQTADDDSSLPPSFGHKRARIDVLKETAITAEKEASSSQKMKKSKNENERKLLLTRLLRTINQTKMMKKKRPKKQEKRKRRRVKRLMRRRLTRSGSIRNLNSTVF